MVCHYGGRAVIIDFGKGLKFAAFNQIWLVVVHLLVLVDGILVNIGLENEHLVGFSAFSYGTL